MKPTELAWNREVTNQLINLYQDNPCLWDVKAPDYRDKLKRKFVIKLISETVHCSEKDVEKRIVSLRAQHRREQRKKIKCERWDYLVYVSLFAVKLYLIFSCMDL